VRVGYFSQFSELSGEATILEVLDGLFADVHAIEEELLEIEIALEDESPQGDELRASSIDRPSSWRRWSGARAGPIRTASIQC
jgi:hypothetical protein